MPGSSTATPRGAHARAAARAGAASASWLTATVATAVACCVAAGAAFAHRHRLPDAGIFAANTTAIITDPADPRLDDPLLSFRREVKRIIRRGGGRARRSQLLDYPEHRRDPVDAVEVEVPGLDAQRLRFGFVTDARHVSASWAPPSRSTDGSSSSPAFRTSTSVKRFVTRLGGAFDDATIRPGRREFVG